MIRGVIESKHDGKGIKAEAWGSHCGGATKGKWQEWQKLTGSADGLKASSYNKVATTAPVKGPTQKIQW